MIFTDIRLQNFRSYIDTSFELGQGVTIVVGPNAAGKTNLIEALMLVAAGTTYKSEADAISQGKNWARIDVHTKDNDQRTVILKNNDGLSKEYEVEQKKYKRLPYIKKQPVVLFEPNDLWLIHGDPSGRRKFIDEFLGQMEEGYKTSLNRYKKVLAQRNALLKNNPKDEKQFFVWNVRLAEQAAEVVKKRIELVTEINKNLSKIYCQIAKSDINIEVKYTSKTPLQNYSTNLLKNLEKSIQTDIARGFTGQGPHRDDLEFEIEGKQNASQSSRGETRSLILALKLIQLELFEQKLCVRPLLLLDDVFSELDGQRRKSLTNYLKKYQTIITTTDADIVIKSFSKNCTVIALG
jgi:DNA replication and repair protein RecF